MFSIDLCVNMSERALFPGAGQPLVISFLFRINRQGQSKFCEQADAGD